MNTKLQVRAKMLLPRLYIIRCLDPGQKPGPSHIIDTRIQSTTRITAHLGINMKDADDLSHGLLIGLHGKQPAFDRSSTDLLQDALQSSGLLAVIAEGQMASVGQDVQSLILRVDSEATVQKID